MRDAIARVKGADPSVAVVACVSGNLVSVPELTEAVLSRALAPGHRGQGVYASTPAETAVLDRASGPWRDAVIRRPDGGYVFEVYGPTPEAASGQAGEATPRRIAVAVYAAPDNGQRDRWLEQARFALDDVGFDGLYVDQLNLAFSDLQRFSYDRWDGTTVDVDPTTGHIVRRYTDGALVGIDARSKLIAYLRARGAVMVANTQAAGREVQSAPIPRFVEGGDVLSERWHADGEPPPLSGQLAKAQLGSPIALGMPGPPGDGRRLSARSISQHATVFLGHGLLYYHFDADIPETGPGSGEYGALHHLFPITPRRIGRGFIVGAERIVTAVSGTFPWEDHRPPSVSSFDGDGRRQPARVRLARTATGWNVEVRARDWQEIVVVSRDADEDAGERGRP